MTNNGKVSRYGNVHPLRRATDRPVEHGPYTWPRGAALWLLLSLASLGAFAWAVSA